MVSYPEIRRRSKEEWFDHLSRLERYHTRGKPDGLYYRVVTQVLNAADYGTPQKRERVFIVAFRNDLHLEWSFPPCTHSQDALFPPSQFVTREYWDRHRIPKKLIPKPNARLSERIERLRDGLLPFLQPWRTVRDAISDLPAPARKRGAEEPSRNHFQIPGARRYVGHTGSSLDEPAKTLKAGDHGVPGVRTCWLSQMARFDISPSGRAHGFRRFLTSLCFRVHGPKVCDRLGMRCPCGWLNA